MIGVMGNIEFSGEQKQVHVALSSFVSSMIRSTTISGAVVNLPEVVSEESLLEPRKYRPGPENAPIAPLDLSM
jgi:hypothetical protein